VSLRILRAVARDLGQITVAPGLSLSSLSIKPLINKFPL
jgi:hypothetical protein